METAAKRIEALQNRMRNERVDMYLIPTADFHQSEYVGEYFKCRAYMSGFTGSAGTLLVEQDKAALWTDGRYFIQAQKELKGSPIILMRMGEEGVPGLEEYIEKNIPQNGCLGFDGRVVSAGQGKALEKKLAQKQIKINGNIDFVDAIWQDRPPISKEPAFLLDASYTGKTREEKIEKLREEIEKLGADVHILTSLDDIAWLLNIRGNDVRYNPVILSYAAVTQNEFFFFVHREALGEKIADMLEKSGITIKPYEEIYQYAENISQAHAVLLNEKNTNYALVSSISPACRIIDKPNPTTLWKAVKTQKEMENMRKAHIKDGAAMCRFICWLKRNVGNMEITELSAAARAEEFRKMDEDFLSLSFSSIAAYGANAAMCHYSPTKESDAAVEPRGFFLLDSGAQYWQGTTDITRTIALGALSEEEKLHFTLVLKGHIRLAMAKFLYGCSGLSLDYLARQPLWDRGEDFNHGTGHGIGYLLNVHEGPNGFRYKVLAGSQDITAFEEGMITTNEPGFYLEGEYGIRTENVMICKKAEKNKYGQFMEFETITLVPIDRDAIIADMLSLEELKWLNEYHARVYHTISPLLSLEEKEWLKEATAPISC